MIAAMVLAQLTYAQKKVGIINFAVNGKEREMSMSSSEPAADLYFIGPNSAQLKPEERTTDAMVRLTEKKLAEYLGYEIIPTNIERGPNVPDEMNGSLWAMESISEKTAFTKLGYDEAIIVKVSISSSGSTPKGYKAVMEISYKLIGKDGKTISKKTEKLKVPDVIDSRMVRQRQDNSPITLKSVRDAISVNGSNTTERAGSELGGGLPATQVYDLFQQCLNNLIIDSK